jgi:hypothetical protein
MTTWEEVTGDKPISPGSYRFRATVRAPYNATIRAAIENGIKIQIVAKGGTPGKFASAPPLYSSSGTLMPWPFTHEFAMPVRDPNKPVQAGLDPRAFLLIVAGVVVLGLTFFLVEHKLERLVTTVGEQVRDTTKPLFDLLSPGTLVLALLGLVLVLRARRA